MFCGLGGEDNSTIFVFLYLIGLRRVREGDLRLLLRTCAAFFLSLTLDYSRGSRKDELPFSPSSRTRSKKKKVFWFYLFPLSRFFLSFLFSRGVYFLFLSFLNCFSFSV